MTIFRLDYSEWTLFVGILILGIAVDRLSKPSYKKKFSYKVSKEHEREIFAKTLFSESVQVVTSQNLETVYANADFGRLTLDLRQAQFMTDRPQIVVQANFSQVIIRVPKDWQVDTHGLHTSLAGVKGYDSLGERGLSSTTVSLTGSVSFGQNNCQTLKMMKERKLIFFLANPFNIKLNTFTNSAILIVKIIGKLQSFL